MTLGEFFNFIISLPKTLIFNLTYFPLKTALRIPVLISHSTCLHTTKGKVILPPSVRPGLIKIGFEDVSIFDKSKSRSIWYNTGVVEFKGEANIGHGSKINCAGKLIIGENFVITAESTIVCKDEIAIGSKCLISWDVLIMDTDYHVIKDDNGKVINENKKIQIGNSVWIGCRALILKGVSIEENTVVAAGSIVTKSIQGKNQIIAGTPAKLVKTGVSWGYS